MYCKRTVACLLLAVFINLYTATCGAFLLEPPPILSQTAVLMDSTTGQILYQKDMNQKMYPASITKILTILLALEKSSLADKVTITEDVLTVPRNTTHISLTPGEEVTLEQLIYAAFLESANDACVAIAVHVSGSVDAFCSLMNERAAETGAKNSHFSNPHGLFDETHMISALDMAAITREALKNPLFRQVFTARSYSMPPNNKQKDTRYFSTKLSFFKSTPYEYPAAIGGKNGWTTPSGNTLVTAAQKDGTELICVLLSSPNANDKFSDTISLFNYGFDSFQKVTLPAQSLKQQSYTAGKFNEVNKTEYTAKEDFTYLLHKSYTQDAVSVTYVPTPNSTEGSPYAANIALKDASVKLMPPQIGVVPLYAPPTDTPSIEPTAEKVDPFSLFKALSIPLLGAVSATAGWVKKNAVLLLFFFAPAALLLILLLIRRQLILRQRKKRQRRRRQQLLRMEQQQQLRKLQMQQEIRKRQR